MEYLAEMISQMMRGACQKLKFCINVKQTDMMSEA